MLVNASLLTEGYDDPSIACVMVLRPSLSEIFVQQAVGRGTRIYCPNGCTRFCQCSGAKRDLLLLDPLWLHETNNLVRPASLVTDDPWVRDEINRLREPGSTQDLLTVAVSAAAKREAALARELAAKRARAERVISLVQWAERFGLPELLTFQSTQPWHDSPITGKQETMLRKFKIPIDQVINRGHANAIISSFLKQKSPPKKAEASS